MKKITLAVLKSEMHPCSEARAWWESRGFDNPHQIWDAMCRDHEAETFSWVCFASDLLSQQLQAKLIVELFKEHPLPDGKPLSDVLTRDSAKAILAAVTEFTDGVVPTAAAVKDLLAANEEAENESIGFEGRVCALMRSVCAVLEEDNRGIFYPIVAISDVLLDLADLPSDGGQRLAGRELLRKRLLNYNPFEA